MDPKTTPAAPVLSVVVPAHGVEEYLEDCIASILRQRVDQEILLVVDPSPDRTAQVARRLAARHPGIRLLENPRTLGPGATRNVGLRAARGTYVAFPDSDDLVADGAYRAVLDVLESTGSDMATSRADEFGRAPGRRPYWTQEAAVYETGARRTTLDEHPELVRDHTAWSKIYRRAFLEEQGIAWPEGVLCEDVVPATRAYAAATAIDVVPRCTYLYRRRSGSITTRLAAEDTLEDWSTQTLEALTVLEDAQQPRALQEMLGKILRHEVPGRLEAAGTASDPQAAAAVRKCVDVILDRAESGTLDRLPSELAASLDRGASDAAPIASGPESGGAGQVPLVSVVIPTHDVVSWIDECLQSVLEQDHPALEIIVVDDHSTDGTWERIQEYTARDERVIALRNPGDGGARARNAGVERSRGEYLIFADGDDVVPLHSYSRLVGAARRHDAEVVVGGFLKFWATGAWKATGYGIEQLVPSTTLLDHPALIRNRTCWNKLVRRDLWARLGLEFPSTPRANDIVPVTRLLASADRITVVPDVVYEYRARPGGSSMTDTLGSTGSTIAYLTQELECATVLGSVTSTRLSAVHWSSVLGGDVWTALGRLADADHASDADSLGKIAGSLQQLLDQAPEAALREIGPRRRLGIAAAARGDLRTFGVLRDVESARGTAGVPEDSVSSPRSAAAERHRRAVLGVATALRGSAEDGLDRSSIVTLLREEILTPVLRTPGAWAPTGQGPGDLLELARQVHALSRSLHVGESATPGTDEPRVLAALLRADVLPSELVHRTLRGDVVPLAATVVGSDRGQATLAGTGRAPRRLLARPVRPTATAGGPSRTLLADLTEQGEGWTAVVDLTDIALGIDHRLSAVLEDDLGERVAPLALETTVRPGRLDRLRFAGEPGEVTVRALEGGASRVGRAATWRLRKVRRAVERRRNAAKER